MNFIELDTSIYALQAIEQAVYDLSAEIVLTIEINNGCYKISAQNGINEGLRNKFMLLVYDHQIRVRLDAQFLQFRLKIVERAINPT